MNSATSTSEPKIPADADVTQAPILASVDDWSRYEPDVERLIRDVYTNDNPDAIVSTVHVNTSAMWQSVRVLIELLEITSDTRVGVFGCGYGIKPLCLHEDYAPFGACSEVALCAARVHNVL